MLIRNLSLFSHICNCSNSLWQNEKDHWGNSLPLRCSFETNSQLAHKIAHKIGTRRFLKYKSIYYIIINYINIFQCFFSIKMIAGLKKIISYFYNLNKKFEFFKNNIFLIFKIVLKLYQNCYQNCLKFHKYFLNLTLYTYVSYKRLINVNVQYQYECLIQTHVI